MGLATPSEIFDLFLWSDRSPCRRANCLSSFNQKSACEMAWGSVTQKENIRASIGHVQAHLWNPSHRLHLCFEAYLHNCVWAKNGNVSPFQMFISSGRRTADHSDRKLTNSTPTLMCTEAHLLTTTWCMARACLHTQKAMGGFRNTLLLSSWPGENSLPGKMDIWKWYCTNVENVPWQHWWCHKSANSWKMGKGPALGWVPVAEEWAL